MSSGNEKNARNMLTAEFFFEAFVMVVSHVKWMKIFCSYIYCFSVVLFRKHS